MADLPSEEDCSFCISDHDDCQNLDHWKWAADYWCQVAINGLQEIDRLEAQIKELEADLEHYPRAVANALAEAVYAFTNLTHEGRVEDGGDDLDEALDAYREANE